MALRRVLRRFQEGAFEKALKVRNGPLRRVQPPSRAPHKILQHGCVDQNGFCGQIRQSLAAVFSLTERGITTR